MQHSGVGRYVLVGATAALVAAAPAAAAAGRAGPPAQPARAQANAASFGATVSGDGRFVAFSSDASNLVPGDSNHATDVFVRDVRDGTTRRLSVGPGGRQADGSSGNAVISRDGRVVAFTSGAANLVPGDTNGVVDIFVRDRVAGVTRRVGSGDTAGYAGDQLAISGNGRFVMFRSAASNLVPGDDNGIPDVFVRDLEVHRTSRVSVGVTWPGIVNYRGGTISADGHFAAFVADAALPPFCMYCPPANSGVYRRDLTAGTTAEAVPPESQGYAYTESAAISADGQHVAYTRMWFLHPSVYYALGVRDLVTGTGDDASQPISGYFPEGRFVGPSLNADGRTVLFRSDAGNLVPNDTNQAPDVFLRDLGTGVTTRISVDGQGGQLAAGATEGNLSAGNGYAAFVTTAPGVVPGDTNGVGDVFLRDFHAGTVRRVSVG
jgi:Tol biopolymer transport system component